MSKNDRQFEKIENILKFHKPKIQDLTQEFAVFIPLMEIDGEISLIYQKRAENLNRNPGDISFPGGKMEERETPRYAALRELCEEMKISHKEVEVYGELDSILHVGSLLIYIFVGRVKEGIEFKDLKPSKDEVKEIFHVPLKFFLENEPEKYDLVYTVQRDENFPYELIHNGKNYNFAKGKNTVLFYKYKDRAIWGLTAKMTNNFINTLKASGFLMS